MFGLSKREIEARIADKIVEELKEDGIVRLRHVGVLLTNDKDKKVEFTADPQLLKELGYRNGDTS